MNEDAVRDWLRKAEHDLKIARDELATTEPVTDMVCFHFQQGCEKYLKAFLIFHGQEYPRTHDLALLTELCRKIDPAFTVLMEWDVNRLTKYAVSVRYDVEVFPTLAETREALEVTEKVKAFVLQRLREKGFNPRGPE